METYKFKLIDSQVPVIKGKKIITDANVGGTKNTYEIRIVYKINIAWELFGIPIPQQVYHSRKLGTKTFWRPYQENWNKKGNRLHAPYWGKGPLLNLWLVLSNDYADPSKVAVLLTESDTTKHCCTVLGIKFLSQELNKNLKLNQSFYQSKIVKL